MIKRSIPRAGAWALTIFIALTLTPRSVVVSHAADSVEPAAGTHSWRTVERMVPVVTGPNDDVPVELDTRLYVPDNATKATPQPAILMTNGFGLDKDANEVVTTAKFFAAHGYVVLTYTSSGFGESSGCVTLQSRDWDVKSARQLIDQVLEPRAFVARDSRGVRIGTIGGSYGGGIQLPLAAADDRIRASIPGRTWNDLGYSLVPNNYVTPGDPTGFSHERNQQGVFKQQWTTLFLGYGNTAPAQGDGGCPEAKAASGDPQQVGSVECQGFYSDVCRTFERLSTTGNLNDDDRRLIRRASASTFMDQVDIPVLLVQGERDTLFNLNEAVATYTALQRRGVPVGMIWNSGGHGGYPSKPGECEVYDGHDRSVAEMDNCYLTLRSLRWMDHWLRGTTGGRGPAFTYYRDWVPYAGQGPNDEQYGAASQFPLPASTTFTLSGPDALAAPGTTAQAGSATFANPPGGEPAAYSETSNFMGPESAPYLGDTPPVEQPGQFAAFTSAPFSSAVSSVGVPSARLRITNTNGQDMVFYAKVYDVAPDGSETLVHRLISPVRVPASAVGDPVRVKLLGFAHRFEKGHRVRLVLSSTDQTSYNAKVADVLTVQTGSGSTFTLPGKVSVG